MNSFEFELNKMGLFRSEKSNIENFNKIGIKIGFKVRRMGVGFGFTLCEWSETTTCRARFWKLLPNVNLPRP